MKMLNISTRPAGAPDRSFLPSLPSGAVQHIPDFSAEPVTSNDFDLFGSSPFAGVKVGDSKKTIEDVFGASDDKEGLEVVYVLSSWFPYDFGLDEDYE